MEFQACLIFLLSVAYTSGDVIPWPPKVNYTIMPVDHFNFRPHELNFTLRYLYENKWHKPNGPIFFYCGNEGPIEAFWNNSGFIFELASMKSALVVFAEHRYYGKSLPFRDSFSQPYIQFLSISQALADYAYLISDLQEKLSAKKLPVIAFGGSYGGMLAAYMRVRYPHLVTGAIAASSPVNWVAGEGNFHQFFESVTQDFTLSKPNCSDRIREAYKAIDKIVSSNKSGLQLISQKMRLCNVMKNKADYEWMLKWTRNAFVMLAMMDYPTKANFMASLPAFPVNVSCAKAIKESDPIASLREAIGVMYNSSNNLRCYDYKTQYIECADITGCGLGNDSLAWDFQSCTEMNLFDESGSTSKDMFPSLPLTRAQLTAYCQRRWGVNHRFRQLQVYFGSGIWKTASNIIFSNGDLDPWRLGGIIKDPSSTVQALTIHGGAHHLDLRTPDPNDPPSARIVRQAEANTIISWINNFHG